MKPSLRFQVIQFLAGQDVLLDDFLPYINERDGIGNLLKKKHRIPVQMKKPKRYCNSPLPFQLEQQKRNKFMDRRFSLEKNSSNTLQKKSIKDKTQLLTYLLQKKQDELTEKQIQSLLTTHNEYQKNNYNDLSNYLEEKDLMTIYPGQNEKSKKLEKNSSPKLKLQKKLQFDSKTLEFLNYSIDQIKPKKVTNIIISKNTKNGRISTEKARQFYSRQITPRDVISQIQTNKNERMYQNLIQDVNKSVRNEQVHNQENLLYPNKHLSLSPIDGSFALKNQEILQTHFEDFKKRRRRLYELQQKMENIITYRRYGERNIEDEKWYLQ